MCQKAAETAASLMSAIEPTLKSLLEYTDLLNTPDGQAAIAAYDAALTALQNWQTGTVAQNVLELIGDFQTVFNTLPLPSSVITLTNIILAGIEAVIAVITANSPAPASSGGTASTEETQALWQAHIASQAQSSIHALVPNFKRSLFHSAAHQYVSTWNKAVEAGNLPASLKA